MVPARAASCISASAACAGGTTQARSRTPSLPCLVPRCHHHGRESQLPFSRPSRIVLDDGMVALSGCGRPADAEKPVEELLADAARIRDIGTCHLLASLAI